MKGKFIAHIIAIVILMTLPLSAVGTEKNTIQKLYFYLDEGQGTGYETIDLLTSEYYEAEDVWAEFQGSIKTKGELRYLSPLSGIISIDYEVYPILVKPNSPSEPIFYYEYESGFPGEPGYSLMKDIYSYVEVNIGGNRYMGTLISRQRLIWVGFLWETNYSELHFEGLVDYKWVQCTLKGLWPELQ